jgi:hypothetical protein
LIPGGHSEAGEPKGEANSHPIMTFHIFMT